MTEAQAKARLERMVAATEAPRLTEAELGDLLTLAARADRSGRSTQDVNWEPTYNLAAAASQGWTWKAGKAAGGYDFSADGSSFSRSQLHAHCLAMAKHYASLTGISSVQVSTGASTMAPQVVGNAAE